MGVLPNRAAKSSTDTDPWEFLVQAMKYGSLGVEAALPVCDAFNMGEHALSSACLYGTG